MKNVKTDIKQLREDWAYKSVMLYKFFDLPMSSLDNKLRNFDTEIIRDFVISIARKS